MSASAFKHYQIFGLRDIQDRMSIEQRSLYIVDQGTLTIVMLASVFGTLVISFGLFWMQFAIEGERLRREARACKARRLRYKKDNSEVTPPELPSSLTHGGAKFFHTFLSHVWGTGALFLA